MFRTAAVLLQAPVVLGADWVYANKGSTEADSAAQDKTWGPVADLCTSGKEQSPVNVVTNEAVGTSQPVIETSFDTNTTYVKNTGHGFQLFETSPKEHVYDDSEESKIDEVGGGSKGYSMIGGAKYNFYQVHWHAPSENTIDGKSYALEAHFVHQLDDAALHGTLHRLAVIGLMYELSEECNPVLDKFWASFPSTKGVSQYSGENVDFNAKLNSELAKGYYHWWGSLTTPPCTEGVSWNLLKTSQKVCQRQLDSLKAALAATQDGIGFNNRAVQPLNHRIVTEVIPPVTTTTAPASTSSGETVSTASGRSFFASAVALLIGTAIAGHA